MSRIPADVERLMWLVAEEGNPNAIEDFEQRFPHLKAELAKRRSMVSGLKGAKRQAVVPPAIPVFRPRSPAPAPMPKLTWVFAVVALGVLAFASYKLTSSAVQPPEPPPIEKTIPSTIGTNPDQPATAPPGDSASVTPKKVEQPATTPGSTPPEEKPAYLKPISLKMKHVSLKVLLVAIEAQSSMHLDIGPGMPDPVVDADYENQTAIEILTELGKEHGFTAFDQGNGSIVIVPATDSTGLAPDLKGGERSLKP